MTSRRPQWVLTFARYALCVAALGYLVTQVSWYDHVRLNDAKHTRVRLIEERGETLVIVRNGQTQEIGLDQVRRVADGTVLDIEYGLSGVARRIDGRITFWAILLFLPCPLLQSLRFVWMLRVQEVRLSFWNALKLSYAGNFFSFALPGTTGGDLIKAYYLTRFTPRKTEAVTTVFLDRLIGMVGFLMLASFMMLFSWDPQRFGAIAMILALLSGALGLAIVVVFSRRARSALRLSAFVERMPMGEHLMRIGRATIALRQHKTLVALSLGITIVGQVVLVLSAFVMARALGMKGDVEQYLVYIPVGFLIAAIPISPPQAFGVLEYAYIQFFTRGVLEGLNTASQAVALALGVRVIQLVWALPGVLVPLFGAHLPSREDLMDLEHPDVGRVDVDNAGSSVEADAACPVMSASSQK